MSPIPWPTFLVPGAGKSGTTYLLDVLKQHKEIFVPYVKEPAFFSTYPGIGLYHKGVEFYRKQFWGYKGEPHIGEGSTVYMYDPESPKLIRKHIPNVKLIFLLRNPVDRVYSNYWQDIKAGVHLPEFSEFIFSGSERAYEMLYCSQYDVHLRRYLEYFPKEQILIVLSDFLKSNPHAAINSVLAFLEASPLPETFRLDFVSNPSALPRSRVLARMLRQQAITQTIKGIVPSWAGPFLKRMLENLRHANQVAFQYPPMDTTTRKRLVTFFLPTVEWLEKFLEMDLSHWKQ